MLYYLRTLEQCHDLPLIGTLQKMCKFERNKKNSALKKNYKKKLVYN